VVFSSPTFLFVFLPLVVLAYYAAPRSFRNGVLLTASLLFYAWGEPRLCWVIVASAVLNHVFGLLIERTTEPRRRTGLLIVGVLLNLAPLAYYKYAMFALQNLTSLGERFGWSAWSLPTIVMPIGISFFTFQGLSYIVDVYRRETVAQRSLATTMLYIALFPQLIAGPIVRYVDVAAQLRDRTETWANLAAGVRRFIVGLAKKVLIANALAGAADAVFEIPDGQLTAAVAWLGIVCYSLQIYFDFSGYSDMAIGLGRMFGLTFLENFRYPYTAQSITEFWRRWHISLSTWYRDYVYIPLGGSRCGPVRTYANLFIVFALCGLWHGASWTFVAWGLFHGVFLVVERAGLSRVLDRCAAPLRHAYSLGVVTCGWVLFRAADMTQAASYLKALFGFGAASSVEFAFDLYFDQGLALALIAGAIGSCPTHDLLCSLQVRLRRAVSDRAAETGVALFGGLRLCTLAALYWASAGSLVASTYNPFIYFRF